MLDGLEKLAQWPADQTHPRTHSLSFLRALSLSHTHTHVTGTGRARKIGWSLFCSSTCSWTSAQCASPLPPPCPLPPPRRCHGAVSLYVKHVLSFEFLISNYAWIVGASRLWIMCRYVCVSINIYIHSGHSSHHTLIHICVRVRIYIRWFAVYIYGDPPYICISAVNNVYIRMRNSLHICTFRTLLTSHSLIHIRVCIRIYILWFAVYTYDDPRYICSSAVNNVYIRMCTYLHIYIFRTLLTSHSPIHICARVRIYIRWFAVYMYLTCE